MKSGQPVGFVVCRKYHGRVLLSVKARQANGSWMRRVSWGSRGEEFMPPIVPCPAGFTMDTTSSSKPFLMLQTGLAASLISLPFQQELEWNRS